MIKNNYKKILLIVGLGVIIFLIHNYYKGFTLEIVKFQNKKIIEITRNLKHGKSIYLTIMALFIYGVAHSLGPGHGKSIISSTALVEKSYKKIFTLSFLITYLQGISALIIVLILGLVEKRLKLTHIEETGGQVQFLTSAIILLISLYLMYKMIFKNNHKRIPEKKDSIDETEKREYKKKNAYYIAFLVGIIPCYGVVNILLFLKILHLSKYNLISVLSITTGMFFVVSLFGVITLKFKKVVIKKDNSVLKILKFIGIFLIFLYTLNYLIYYISIN